MKVYLYLVTHKNGKYQIQDGLPEAFKSIPMLIEPAAIEGVAYQYIESCRVGTLVKTTRTHSPGKRPTWRKVMLAIPEDALMELWHAPAAFLSLIKKMDDIDESDNPPKPLLADMTELLDEAPALPIIPQPICEQVFNVSVINHATDRSHAVLVHPFTLEEIIVSVGAMPFLPLAMATSWCIGQNIPEDTVLNYDIIGTAKPSAVTVPPKSRCVTMKDKVHCPEAAQIKKSIARLPADEVDFLEGLVLEDDFPVADDFRVANEDRTGIDKVVPPEPKKRKATKAIGLDRMATLGITILAFALLLITCYSGVVPQGMLKDVVIRFVLTPIDICKGLLLLIIGFLLGRLRYKK